MVSTVAIVYVMQDLVTLLQLNIMLEYACRAAI
jgi:hypothetical protein